MTFQNRSLVHVYFVGSDLKCQVGRLAYKERKIFFEYDSEFIKLGLQLSPFKLPLQVGVISSTDHLFDGLFGVFHDSLPDGWGRLLLDRKLVKLGLNLGAISPLDRLCFVGSRGMGALRYEPENQENSLSDWQDLDIIAEEIRGFQEGDQDRFVEDLFHLGGSSSGVRPKILISIGGKDWIIKFRSYTDPTDMGNIEYAYHLMAREAKLDLPEAKLFRSRRGPGYFGVKRFDRRKGNPIHMHTISGLLHADHRLPSLDYRAIMRTTWYLTRDVRQCEKQFRAAVFNIAAHNRDDHAKNFSFLMDAEGSWFVSPAYDLTFAHGPGGEHCTMIMGEGKEPKLSHLLQLANVGGIKKSKATEIIDEVRTSISKWNLFAEIAKVKSSSRKMIQKALSQREWGK